MRIFALATLCLFAQATAQAPAAQAEAPSGSFAVRCGKLYIGDGQILENAWLVIRGGLIREVTVGGDAAVSVSSSWTARRTSSSSDSGSVFGGSMLMTGSPFRPLYTIVDPRPSEPRRVWLSDDSHFAGR